MDFARQVSPWRWGGQRMAIVLTACTAFSVLAAVPAGTASAAGSPGPPPLAILTAGADNGNGDIFLEPQGSTSYASGPEIVTPAGRVVWFHPLPAGDFVTDFRTQTYLGKPVLTWYQYEVGGGSPTTITSSRSPPSGRGTATRLTSTSFLITPWISRLASSAIALTAFPGLHPRGRRTKHNAG